MMVTIFDGMEKLTEEQLRYEVAMHEQIRMAAFAGQTAKKAQKASIRLANKLTGLVGAKQFEEPEIIPLAEQVQLGADALFGYDKEDLIAHLRDELCLKLEKLGVKDAMSMTSERQSVLITAKAAEGVDGISAYLTPLRKAQQVAEKNTAIEVTDFKMPLLDSKLQKSLLAHTVMLCVQAYGEPFAPAEDTLPGYLCGIQKEEYESQEKKAETALKENADFAGECEELEHVMEMKKNQAKTQESMILSLEEKETTLLHKETDGNNGTAGEEKEAVEKMLEETRQKLEECRSKKKEYEEEYYAKKVEYELIAQKTEENNRSLEEWFGKKAQAMEEVWKNAFTRLEWKDGVIAETARKFNYTQQLSLEEALKELDMAENPENLDESTGDDSRRYYICRFSMEPGCAGRIAYRVKERKVLILQIQKNR